MSRKQTKWTGLKKMLVLASLALATEATAQTCDDCKTPAPPPVLHKPEGAPRIRFKPTVAKPICEPCNLPNFGYHQAQWSPWPGATLLPDPPPVVLPRTHMPAASTGAPAPVPAALAPSLPSFKEPPKLDQSALPVSARAPEVPAPNPSDSKLLPEWLPPPVPAPLTAPPVPEPPVPQKAPTGSEPLPLPPPLPGGSMEEANEPPLPPGLPRVGGEKPSVPLPAAVAPSLPEPTALTNPPRSQPPEPATTRPQRPRRVGPNVGGDVRMVNSKRILLECDLPEVARPDQTLLELWFTQDGRKWERDNAILKHGAPCLVEVAREGTFGFTVLARRIGETSAAPATGEKPQVWVEVDWTKPVVHMVQGRIARNNARQMGIVWIATDNNLAQEPITLSYATKPEGPWNPFATNIDNTGRYNWQMPPGLTGPVYLRVEASDLVGNTGIAQSNEAVVVQDR